MKFNQKLVLTVMLLCVFTQAFSRKIKSYKASLARSLAKLIDLPTLAHGMAYESDIEKHKAHLDEVEKFEGAKNKIAGFVGYTTSPKVAIVVYIRGTSNLENVLADVAYNQENFGGVSACQNGCTVHNGMFKAYMEIKQLIFDKFMSISKKIIDEKKMTIDHIFFTGHSLGGALSNFAAYNFIHRKRYFSKMLVKDAEAKYFDISKVSLVTFGAPRVGNKAFADYMKSLLDSKELTRNYRVIYGQDPVPNLPPKQIELLSFIEKYFPVKEAKGNKDVKKTQEVKEKLELEAGKTKVVEFEHAGTEIRYSKDTITDEINKKEETLKAAFAQITPVRGQANVDNCENEPSLWDNLFTSFFNRGDHSFYKYINGQKLWDFIKSTEGKKPANF